jgi:hypothetical protein
MSSGPGPGVGDGLVDDGWWRTRQDDYLAAATTVTFVGSPLNVIDHLEWRRRSGDHDFDPSTIDADAVARWCRRIDGWLDCADFDVLRLLTLWYGYRDDLPRHAVEAIEQRLLDFRYWFTDPARRPASSTSGGTGPRTTG